MFFQDTHSETLFALANFLQQKPDTEELCEYLATSVCPTGELSRVYIGRLDNDAVIRTEMTFGYALDSEVTDLAIPLESDRPVADALRKKKIVIGNKKELFDKYSEVQDVDNRSSWASTAAIPTHSGYVFAFLLQCTIEEPEYALFYFRVVCALLGFYNFEEVRAKQLTRKRVKNQLQNARVFASKGSPLTERQELITDLIKKSKTNGQIGHMLGYSESLIRQETIIIYQKLGVEGRRELIQSKVSDQP